MTHADHARLLAARKITADLLKKYKGKYRAFSLAETLRKIDERLKEPVEDEVNTGDHLKTDNPFV